MHGFAGRVPNSGEIYEKVADAVEMMTYGGEGYNRFARLDEIKADRNAAVFHAQVLLRRMTRDFGKEWPDRTFWARFTAFGLGGIYGLVLLSSKVLEGPQRIYEHDHPRFDIKLEMFWEGWQTVFENEFGTMWEGFTGKHLKHCMQLVATLNNQANA